MAGTIVTRLTGKEGPAGFLEWWTNLNASWMAQGQLKALPAKTRYLNLMGHDPNNILRGPSLYLAPNSPAFQLLKSKRAKLEADNPIAAAPDEERGYDRLIELAVDLLSAQFGAVSATLEVKRLRTCAMGAGDSCSTFATECSIALDALRAQNGLMMEENLWRMTISRKLGEVGSLAEAHFASRTTLPGTHDQGWTWEEYLTVVTNVERQHAQKATLDAQVAGPSALMASSSGTTPSAPAPAAAALGTRPSTTTRAAAAQAYNHAGPLGEQVERGAGRPSHPPDQQPADGRRHDLYCAFHDKYGDHTTNDCRARQAALSRQMGNAGNGNGGDRRGGGGGGRGANNGNGRNGTDRGGDRGGGYGPPSPAGQPHWSYS
jgi:hypothetical protein